MVTDPPYGVEYEASWRSSAPITRRRTDGAPPTLPPSRGARARARGEAGNQRPWPADKVERWSIERLIPYAKTARTHTDGDLELAGIMAERTAGLTRRR